MQLNTMNIKTVFQVYELKYVTPEVLKAMTINTVVIWYATPCSLANMLPSTIVGF
jgi:hypothetical protein